MTLASLVDMHTSSLTKFASVFVSTSALAAACMLPGCAVDPSSGALLNESTSTANELTGGFPVGTELVTTDTVNMRVSPDLNGEILQVIPVGTTVFSASSTPSGIWYGITFNGITGWVSGDFLTKLDSNGPPPGASGALTAAAIRAKLGCNVLSNSRYAFDEGGSATIPVCGAGTAIHWTADMDIDCDGRSSSVCNRQTDASFQSQTAGTDSSGRYLDASVVPYIVVPMVSSRFNYAAAGIRMGSAALVLYGDKIAYATVGDVGPKDILGEASYAVAKKLGINANPSSGGVDSGVTYIVFPGIANDVGNPEDPAAVAQKVRTIAEAWLRSR
jgi:uncharacterized protein YgiM (DUF1202 family)